MQAAAHATTEECIILTGYSGRPKATIAGKLVNASRAVWIIANGDPGELHVLHTCNGGSGADGCINIRHLYAGDDAQNTRDKVQAGRTDEADHRYERNGRAVLERRQVQAIRTRYQAGGVTQAQLAAEYGVATQTISRILLGETWAGIDDLS